MKPERARGPERSAAGLCALLLLVSPLLPLRPLSRTIIIHLDCWKLAREAAIVGPDYSDMLTLALTQ